jgi:hypothetical protein
VVSLTPIRIVNIWAWLTLCALLVAACGRLGGSQGSNRGGRGNGPGDGLE